MKNEGFRYSDCPMHRSMAILGTKWKPIVIYALRERTARFGQLHASIGSISRKVLTTTLKELEQDEVIFREEFKEIPPRVEYSLTERGKALLPIMYELVKWDKEYCEISEHK
ncbi:transcriptional regulator, HxlR family [Pustulibacterium marinum]|uniref:Transcriptional regulator, HxlR family n=1 Tax=Pustulibacterium marinum TaxID=1224947 RepID=A0A1I7GP58_9FLAO|nr:helix-turn-helix domain-containing protein [Pustulibacterium marinum]SFU50217.1 transcriptional regulator, HxlR family [Pustulibacterium marinum]